MNLKVVIKKLLPLVVLVKEHAFQVPKNKTEGHNEYVSFYFDHIEFLSKSFIYYEYNFKSKIYYKA